jgi:hypothetical protein
VRRFRWSAAPVGVTGVQRRNFIHVQADAIGVGLANAAAPFLAVLLTRLGASNFQVGLLTSMPALTGLFLSIAVGRFLQSRRQIVPWFSVARFLAISAYGLTGLAAFFVPRDYLVQVVLIIWAVATLPQTVVPVAFTVVMNAVSGPTHRYELMSRRWSILGLVTSIAVAGAGLVLDQIGFPLNYQVVFIALSTGGIISLYFSSRIKLPDADPFPSQAGKPLAQRYREFIRLTFGERAFVRFTLKQFVYLSGTMLSIPIFPLYYVRVIDASDAWIGIINTAQTAVTLIGYFLWTRSSQLRGSRFVLVWTTLGLTFYPALVALTHRVELIAFYSGLAGIFQAGLNLVFFDELMKTVPPKYSATFVSVAQGVQYFPAIIAPMLGSLFASHIGLGGALLVSAFLRLMGFTLFAWDKSQSGALETVLSSKARKSLKKN